MRKIKVGCSFSPVAGARVQDTIEVDDDASDDEIEQIARDWAFDHFDWWFDADQDDDEQ